MQLIKDNAGGVVTVFTVGIGRQNLDKAGTVLQMDLPAAFHRIHTPLQPGQQVDHVQHGVEADRSVILICGADVDLRILLAVAYQVIQTQGRSQFGFSVLFRNLQIQVK